MNGDASRATPHEAPNDAPEPSDASEASERAGDERAADERAGDERASDERAGEGPVGDGAGAVAPAAEGPWASEEDEAWRPPPSLVERASDLLTRGTRAAVVVAALVVALTGLLWAIPTAVVLRSDALETFRARVARHRSLNAYPGLPLEVDRVPVAWSLDERGGRFSLRVRGPLGEALVRGRVRDGEVLDVERQLAISWRDEWWRRQE